MAVKNRLYRFLSLIGLAPESESRHEESDWEANYAWDDYNPYNGYGTSRYY
jgi:hypothetical protein